MRPMACALLWYAATCPSPVPTAVSSASTASGSGGPTLNALTVTGGGPWVPWVPKFLLNLRKTRATFARIRALPLGTSCSLQKQGCAGIGS